jgi:hypothetical protein
MAHSFLGCSPAWCRASFHTQENAPSFKFPHDRGRDLDKALSVLKAAIDARQAGAERF